MFKRERIECENGRRQIRVKKCFWMGQSGRMQPINIKAPKILTMHKTKLLTFFLIWNFNMLFIIMVSHCFNAFLNNYNFESTQEYERLLKWNTFMNTMEVIWLLHNIEWAQYKWLKDKQIGLLYLSPYRATEVKNAASFRGNNLQLFLQCIFKTLGSDFDPIFYN